MSEIKDDPNEMYLLSIRIGGRLPDELHRAMLLWSYDPRANGVVKEYLEWVDRCRERDEMNGKFRRRMASIERNERALNLAIMILMFAALVASTLS